MTWLLAYRYPDLDLALVDWQKVVGLVEEQMLKTNLNHRMVRVHQHGVGPMVIVGGEVDLEEEFQERLRSTLSGGEEISVPPEAEQFFWAGFTFGKMVDQPAVIETHHRYQE